MSPGCKRLVLFWAGVAVALLLNALGYGYIIGALFALACFVFFVGAMSCAVYYGGR